MVGTKAPIEDETEGVNYKHIVGPRYIGVHQVNDIHRHVILIYFAKAKSDIVSDSASEHERAETRWATMEQLKEMKLFPNIEFYAKEALKELGEK